MKNAIQSKVVSFKSIKTGTAFTPTKPDPFAGKVYIKRANGVCPRVGEEQEGVFYPEDKVIPVNLPEKVIRQYAKG